MKSTFRGRSFCLKIEAITVEEIHLRMVSESATTSTTLSSGRVGRKRSHILDSANTKAVTGKSSDSRLGTGSRSLGTGSTSASQFDVNGVDTDILKGFANINGGPM